MSDFTFTFLKSVNTYYSIFTFRFLFNFFVLFILIVLIVVTFSHMISYCNTFSHSNLMIWRLDIRSFVVSFHAVCVIMNLLSFFYLCLWLTSNCGLILWFRCGNGVKSEVIVLWLLHPFSWSITSWHPYLNCISFLPYLLSDCGTS